jgi:hypothetical protein
MNNTLPFLLIFFYFSMAYIDFKRLKLSSEIDEDLDYINFIYSFKYFFKWIKVHLPFYFRFNLHHRLNGYSKISVSLFWIVLAIMILLQI